MDTGVLAACILGTGVVVAAFFVFGGRVIPTGVVPFAALSGEMREKILRWKWRFRCLALALFLLAALSMFSSLPRGVPLAFSVSGFFCQYKGFCLRRRYPMNYTHATQLPARHYSMEDRQ
jgi:hypothetical protein